MSAVVRYTCKYAPVELLLGFGRECRPLDDVPAATELADEVLHAGVCGFGRAVVEAVMAGGVDELVLVNCCDTMRRVYEVVRSTGRCRFVHLLDLPHRTDACARDALAASLVRLRDAYAAYSGQAFDVDEAIASVAPHSAASGAYVGVMGVRASGGVVRAVRESLPFPVRDLTCLGLRDVTLPEGWDAGLSAADGPGRERAFFRGYAAALLGQVPCARMGDATARRHLSDDPGLVGIVYHTLRFCDYYGSEGATVAASAGVPVLRLETDYTRQGEGQVRTRVEAFAEELAAPGGGETVGLPEGSLVAGIDSGSTSTDVVIMDSAGGVVASAVIPTRGSATASAERSLGEALDRAGIARGRIARIVSTGYGRDAIGGTDSVTEITCHAAGAHLIDPSVRTVIDIGGQDSKAISLDADGNVRDFAMNDKCAAGTGRFLEMMARTLGLSLEEMGVLGLESTHVVAMSATCTVFAESEVVSLVARDVAPADIVAALDRSVATRTASLARRVGVEGTVMMTGGVAKNPGVVRAIGERLGCDLVVSGDAQICGAMGAALIALRGGPAGPVATRS